MVEWFERQKIGRIMFFSRPILFRWALEHLPTPKNRATSLEKTRIGKASGCPATLVRCLWIVRFLKKSAGCRPRIGRSSPDYRPIWHFWVQKWSGVHRSTFVTEKKMIVPIVAEIIGRESPDIVEASVELRSIVFRSSFDRRPIFTNIKQSADHRKLEIWTRSRIARRSPDYRTTSFVRSCSRPIIIMYCHRTTFQNACDCMDDLNFHRAIKFAEMHRPTSKSPDVVRYCDLSIMLLLLKSQYRPMDGAIWH